MILALKKQHYITEFANCSKASSNHPCTQRYSVVFFLPAFEQKYYCYLYMIGMLPVIHSARRDLWAHAATALRFCQIEQLVFHFFKMMKVTL